MTQLCASLFHRRVGYQRHEREERKHHDFLEEDHRSFGP